MQLEVSHSFLLRIDSGFLEDEEFICGDVGGSVFAQYSKSNEYLSGANHLWECLTIGNPRLDVLCSVVQIEFYGAH